MTQSHGEGIGMTQVHGDLGPHAGAGPVTDVAVVRRRLLISALFLLVQVAATDYGDQGRAGSGIFWFAVGAGLLWLVHRRRSRVARGVVVVGSLVGAVVYAFGAFYGLHAAVLMVAYVGQALPLLTRPVRQHVQARPS